MARPQKKGLIYFSLDCYIEDNLKLIKAEFGLKGYAIVICLWQKIYGGEGYYTLWNQEVALLFASENNVSVSVVNEVVDACLKRDIFSKEMFDKYSILTSRGIQRRYFEMTARRKELQFENQYLLLNAPKKIVNVNNNSKNVNNNFKNAINNEQSKVKESKYLLLLNDGTYYEVLNEDIELWKQAYPKVDIENQLMQMRSWCDANPQKRKTKRGIKKFITSWLARTNGNSKEVKRYDYPDL